jgi:hypothetical protein
MLGSGIARPVLGAQPRIGIAPPENFGSRDWGGNKVLWALDAETSSIALLRGHQLDGALEVRFDSGAIPAEDKILDPTGKTPLDGGWYDFPGFVRLQGPGCYGFQIDREGEPSAIVVLQAVAGN